VLQRSIFLSRWSTNNKNMVVADTHTKKKVSLTGMTVIGTKKTNVGHITLIGESCFELQVSTHCWGALGGSAGV